MDKYQDDFDEIETLAAEKRQMQNFADQQNEYAGNDVGRVSRFLSADARQILLDKRNGKPSAAMRALDLALLNNPDFAAAYEQTMGILNDAENAAERVLSRLEKQHADMEVRLIDAESDLKITLENAASLADGRRVFQDQDGKIWDEHGKHVDDTIAASIEWNGFEPSHETYLEQQKSVSDLKASILEVSQSILEIRLYQTDTLGNARAELTDPDYSGSVEDVEATEQNIMDQMPEIMREEFRQNEIEPEVSTLTTFHVAKPDLGG